MFLRRPSAILGPAVLVAASWMLVPDAHAQRSKAQIGYVYPAGGKQGTTFEAVVAGQFLAGVNNIHVSGGGVQAKITELIVPINGKELNKLRIQVDELLARKAVVTKDFTALEKFRSFRSAKNVKPNAAESDKELEELKKKYANATWTAEDEARLKEIRRKVSGAVRRPANRAISELAVVEVTVAADAKPGRRELRIGSPSALSNPMAFWVGQLPEFSEKASKAITQQKSTVARTAFAPKSRTTEPELEITLPATVNGQILPGEVDRYRFAATKGQRLVVAAGARQLIPYIADAVPGWFQATLTLYDSQGRELDLPRARGLRLPDHGGRRAVCDQSLPAWRHGRQAADGTAYRLERADGPGEAGHDGRRADDPPRVLAVGQQALERGGLRRGRPARQRRGRAQ